MRTIFTGQTGVRGKQVAERVARFALSQRGLPPDLNHADAARYIGVWCVEDKVKAMCGDKIWTFLDIPDWRQRRRLWQEALDQTLYEIGQREPEHTFLVIHNYFYRKAHYRSEAAKALPRLADFHSDYLVTLIDDSYHTWQRIFEANLADPAASYLRLHEVYAWRTVEIDATDNLALALSSPARHVPNYVVGVKHPVLTMYRLLFEPATPSMYLSVPISEVRERWGAVKEIEAVRRLLHRSYVVFDPLMIDEKLLELRLLANDPDGKGETLDLAGSIQIDQEHRWPVWLDDGQQEEWQAPLLEGTYPVCIPADEVNEVARPIETEFVDRKSIVDDHIQVRDYRILGQADALVAYRPCYGGAPSTGVYAELTFAQTLATPIFTYFPDADRPVVRHPFREYGSTYREVDDWLAALEQYANSQKQRTRRPCRER